MKTGVYLAGVENKKKIEIDRVRKLERFCLLSPKSSLVDDFEPLVVPTLIEFPTLLLT